MPGRPEPDFQLDCSRKQRAEAQPLFHILLCSNMTGKQNLPDHSNCGAQAPLSPLLLTST